MAKAEPKTRPTDASVEDFLNTIEDVRKREDSFAVMRMMAEVSGEEPVMWGSAIVGFGTFMLKYANGSELAWPELAFSPRKTGLTIYFEEGFEEAYAGLLGRLGKHTTSKCCLYIKRLAEVDTGVLTQLLKASLKRVRKGGPVRC